MFARLGHLVTRRPLWVVAAWILVAGTLAAAAMTGFGGTPLFQKLETDQPTVPGSDSEQVIDLLSESADGASVLLMVGGADLTTPEAVAATSETLTTAREEILALDGVSEVSDPYQHPLGPTQPEVAALVDEETGSYLVRVTLEADLADATVKEVEGDVEGHLAQLGKDLVADDLADETLLTSNSIMVREFNHQMESDLVRGESSLCRSRCSSWSSSSAEHSRPGCRSSGLSPRSAPGSAVSGACPTSWTWTPSSSMS